MLEVREGVLDPSVELRGLNELAVDLFAARSARELFPLFCCALAAKLDKDEGDLGTGSFCR